MPRQKKQRLKERSDGRYKCVYNGRQFYGATSEEALAKREEYKRQEATGEVLREVNLTVSAYAKKWLPLHKADVSPKCYRDYEKQLEALTAVIGKMKIHTVTVDDAAAVWIHFAGYSASTIHRAKMLYIALFDSAVQNDLCRKNPFRSRFAQPPKGTTGSHRCITDEEKRLILTTPHRVQLAALIMLYAGLRRGEVLAITRQDITRVSLHYKRITGTNNHNIRFTTASILSAQEIIVNKAVRFVGNAPTIEAPKTASGVRRVPILSTIRPYLQNAPQRILASAEGKLMTSTAWKRAWDSYLHALSVSAGHPVNIRPHDLRHTYCTMLRDAGVDMKQAMLWMGHSDEKMILHVYDHINEKRTQNSVSQVEKLLEKVQNEVQPPPIITILPDTTEEKSISVSDSDSEGHAFESHRAYQ